MRTLTLREWGKYRDILSRLSDQAAQEFRDAVWKTGGYFGGVGLGNIPAKDLVDYAYGLVTKYGEGSAAVSAEMYDEIAELSGVPVPAAVPAETATYDEVAQTLNGVLAETQNLDYVADTLGRLVKQAAADTTLQNAVRDESYGPEFAWINHGDTCAFCITLASRGWQRVSKRTLRKGHAEHIHAHCDCEYAVRFNDEGGVDGYNPDRYGEMYDNAEGRKPKDKINYLRRQNYARHKDEINAQKRAAYAKRMELKRAEEDAK